MNSLLTFDNIIRKIFPPKAKATAVENMTICVAVSLACSFYEYEHFFPAFAAGIIAVVLLICFVVTWLWCAFESGVRKRWSFLVFTALYWIVPHLIIADKVRRDTDVILYDKYVDTAAGFSKLLVDSSLWGLVRTLHISATGVMTILIALCAALFVVGRTVCGDVFDATLKTAADDVAETAADGTAGTAADGVAETAASGVAETAADGVADK